MGTTPNPIGVYPDPDGTSNTTAPSDTRVTGGAAASAAGAAIALAAGSGTAPDPAFLFFQATGRGAGFMSFHAASGTYVAIGIVLASLSAVLSVINLVYGLRMKERLRELSDRVYDVCEKNGVFDWYRKTKKAA